MQQNTEAKNKDDFVNIFVPMTIKRRGNSVVIIVKNTKPQDQKKSFDNRMIKCFAKAYKWKKMLESGEIESLAEISRKEKFTTSYISKIFNLNFISPKIVQRIFDGTQPRDLKLQDITTAKKLPDLWEEQEKMWGF